MRGGGGEEGKESRVRVCGEESKREETSTSQQGRQKNKAEGLVATGGDARSSGQPTTWKEGAGVWRGERPHSGSVEMPGTPVGVAQS